MKALFLLLLFAKLIFADGSSNHNCNNMELISELNNKSTLQTHTEIGTVKRNNPDEDDNDYYYFNISTSGTIFVNYSSEGSTDFYFSNDNDGCGNDRRLNNGTSTSETLDVSSGDTVYIRVKDEGNGLTSYSMNFVFTPDPPSNADLSIIKTVDDTTPDIGDTVTYTIVGTNNGPTTTEIEIVDILPAGLTFVSEDENRGSFSCNDSGQTVTCNGGRDFDTGDSVTITIEAEVTASGTITNTASIASTEGVNDSDNTNDAASVNITVTALGCDSSLDTSANDSSPGTLVTNMHNITSDTTDCISGSSASSDNDYYNFTLGVTGTLNILTSSPNSHDNHFEVVSDIQGTLHSYDTGQNRNLSFDVSANENIIFRTKETGSDTDLWQVDLDFVATNNADLQVLQSTSASPNPATIGENISFGVRTQNRGPNTSENDIILKISYNQDIVISSASQTSGGSDFSCDISSGSLSTGSFITCTKTSDWTSITDNKDFTFVVQATSVGTLTQTATIESTDTADSDTSNNTLLSSISIETIEIIDPNFEDCGIFPSALNTWNTIESGNNDEVIYSDGVYANNGVTKDIDCLDTIGGTGTTCTVGTLTMSAPTLPTFIQSTLNTTSIVSGTLTDTQYGNITIANGNNVSFAPSSTYSNSSTNVMLIKSLTVESGATLTFAAGDYYIDSWSSDASLTVRTTGATRLFINSTMDLTQNHIDFNYDNGNGLSSNMFIFIYGDFIFASNGGGDIQNMTAYVYSLGTFTANHNTANSQFKGAVTSVGNISLNNNQQYIYDDSGLDDNGFGACNTSYCNQNSLSAGFHLIDPDGGSDKNSFEIFCYEDANSIWHDLIALPIKNNSNNFLFNNNATSSNYYDESANPRTHFHAIEIDADKISYSGTLDDGTSRPHIPVIISNDAAPYDITTDGNNYKVMGSSFSNINLIGTPFKIEWDNTDTLSGCNESLLRKALDQAVKYNTINDGSGGNDSQSKCSISTMTLSLLDDYQYLSYIGSEVLQHSCKEMATYIPNNVGILSDADVAGHFNILTTEPAYPDATPTSNGSRNNATDLGATLRPITVYCEYQTDLSYVWTFLTALDAKVTQYKTDLVNKSDTCSQIGLYFYVPNNKDTFNRVRKYLKNSRSGDAGWENYTGTIDEKINALYSGNHYYLSNFRDVKIWPYGPLGVYFPTNGNKDINGNTADWGDGAYSAKEYMSGAPMHNISTASNYDESMGKKGFVSILGSQDLNKTDDWWIADVGAGDEVGLSSPAYSPSGTHPIQSSGYIYYEPNGNYSANAWLNFLFDSEGWIYHNDDWNANYPYYDYMCMSETNYDTANRYSLVPGFFNAIERNTRVGNTSPNFSDTNLTTQILSDTVALDLILYSVNTGTGNIDISQLETDQNKSVGVFLSLFDDDSPDNPPSLEKFLGEYADFDGNNGRITINNFTTSSTSKRAIVQFYYCNPSDMNWTECWDYNGNANSPILTSLGDGNYTDSYNDFAIRPDRFHIVSTTGSVVKAKDVNISYYAYDIGTNPANNYNEPFTNLETNTSLADISKIPNCPNTTLSVNFPNAFTNGVEHNSTTFENVGEFSITINEIDGYEYAVIDADDTSDNDRFITPANINLTIIPDHFNSTAITQINHAPTFTYIANDLDNMALKFDVNVTAKNSSNNTTPNYTTACYSKNINLQLNYSVLNGATMPDTIIYKELNSAIDGNNTATTLSLSLPKNIGDLLPSTLFTTDHNGTAELSLRVNFKRDVNNSFNPFIINFNDLNISDQTEPSLIVYNENDHIIDVDATMLYARTNAPRTRIIGNSGNAFIYYEVFSNSDGNKTILPNGLISAYTDDPRWFVNTLHTNISGNAGTMNQKNVTTPLVTVTTSASGNHLDSESLNYNESKGYPYKTTIENEASTWLIYNKFDATDTKNEFEVEFEGGNSDWAGKDDANITTIRSGTNKTNRRSMW